jgi:hypothetical protein
MTYEGSCIVSDNMEKLYKIHDVPYFDDILLYCGLSGSAADYKKYIFYLHQDKFYEEDLEFCLDGIVVGMRYAYYIESNSPYLITLPRKNKMAVGSGCEYARSAMGLGLTAVQAIHHTKKFDSATGGKVISVRL